MRLPRVRMRLFTHVVWTAGLVFATSSSAIARRADDGNTGAVQAERTDLYDDPLPPGAIARLGTLRDNIGELSGDIVVSPDGKTITATSKWFNIPLRLWDVQSGRVIRRLKNLEPTDAYTRVQRVAFSTDGKLLAAGDAAGTVRIGTTDAGRKMREIPGPSGVSSLAFLPDAKHVAVAYDEGDIRLYSIATGGMIRSLATAPLFMLYVNVFSPDGRMLSTWRSDDRLAIRDTLTGQEIRCLPNTPVSLRWARRPEGLPRDFVPVDLETRAFSPDGKRVACGGGGRKIKLWDVTTGREIRYFPPPPLPPGRPSIDIDESAESHLVFSPDGKLLAAEDRRESLCLWSVTTGQLYRRFPHQEMTHGIAFSADGKRLIAGGRQFRHWDIAGGRQIRRFPEQDKVHSVAFGPGGKTVTTANGTTVRLWDAATGRELQAFRGHHASVSEVAIAGDGKVSASIDQSGTVILWDATTGQQVRPGGDNTEYHPSIAIAPDGKTYAVSDKRGARLCDLATGREIRRFPRTDQAVRCLCYAPDGKTLAAAYGSSVWLWNVATGRDRLALDHLEVVNAMAFAPDGKTLVTGDNSGHVCLWDTATGKGIGEFGEDREMDREAPYVTAIAYLPDGKSVVVAAVADGGAPSSLWIRDTDTGKVRRRLEGHTNFVCGLAVSPDGKILASASADGTTLLWDLTRIGE